MPPFRVGCMYSACACACACALCIVHEHAHVHLLGWDAAGRAEELEALPEERGLLRLRHLVEVLKVQDDNLLGARRQERADLLENIEHRAAHQPVDNAEAWLPLDGGGAQVDVPTAGPEMLRHALYLALGPPADDTRDGRIHQRLAGRDAVPQHVRATVVRARDPELVQGAARNGGG